MSVPKDYPLILARRRSIHNLHVLEISHKAYCFSCLETFSPKEITKWTDKGLTALCPHCGESSVLPAGAAQSREFLLEMKEYWFGKPKGT